VLALVAHQGRAYTPTLMVLRGEGGPSSLHHFLQTQSVVADVKVRRFLPPQAFGPLAFRRGFWESPAELAFPRFAAGAAQVLAAGGLIAAGAHGEFPGLGSHWELWGLASGLGVREAWRAATISAAKSLGLERDLGSIERGKIADILLLSRHPLERAEHSTSLRYVLKGGIVYDADSLARIAPEPAAPPMPFWRVPKSESYSVLLKEDSQAWCAYNKLAEFKSEVVKMKPLESAHITYSSGKLTELTYQIEAESGDWIVIDTYTSADDGMFLRRVNLLAQGNLRIVQEADIHRARVDSFRLTDVSTLGGKEVKLPPDTDFPEVPVVTDLSTIPFVNIVTKMRKRSVEKLCEKVGQ
jgi:hypothetical protein